MPNRNVRQSRPHRAAVELRYVLDDRPGIRRLRAGKGFRFVHPDGSPVKDEATLQRIRSLAIPPAYRDVWIAPDARGHMQATGRDARGRKQYRYHPRWREVRDATKFERMLEFSRALPRIRRRAKRDLALPALPKEKVVAAVVRLLEETCIRIGNEEYARSNDSYGLTTLRDEHVEIHGSQVEFEFRGKRGTVHRCRLQDRRLARVVARCQDVPGEVLFQYLDSEGARQTIDSGDVNDWLRDASGAELTAKDFRTWAGTLAAAEALLEEPAASSVTARRRQVLAVLDRVAMQLFNTRTVARKFYVHPRLLAVFEEGGLAAALTAARQSAGRSPRGLSVAERTLVAFFEVDAAHRAKAN